MATDPDDGDAAPPTLTPGDAFALLGNSTRVGILHALGEADGPLSFSELRDRAGVADSGGFNYHLDKLEGAFLSRTDDGYVLRQAGRRVIEAVFSGVLTQDTGIDRIGIDRPCSYCGAPIEVRVHPGNIEMYCTDCPGAYGESYASGAGAPAGRGYLGRLSLPPAGFQGRTPDEVYHAAQVWGHLEILSIANGVCPRCSARLEHEALVCEDHDAADELCSACGNRYAAMVRTECTNCIFAGKGSFGILLYSHPAVQAFKVSHGVNLVAPSGGRNPLSNLTEEIVSADPFEARFTYAYEGETLTLTVDDDLAVVEAVKGP